MQQGANRPILEVTYMASENGPQALQEVKLRQPARHYLFKQSSRKHPNRQNQQIHN